MSISRYLALVFSLGLLFSSGCIATLNNGYYQPITFKSNPSGAYCKLYRDNEGLVGAINTPERQYIRRDAESVLVSCTKGELEGNALLVHQDIFNDEGVAPHIAGGSVSSVAAGATAPAVYVFPAVGGGMIASDIISDNVYQYQDEITINLQ